MQRVLLPPYRAVNRISRIFHAINDPRYYWITRPLLAFLITRSIVVAAAYLAEIAIPGATGAGYYHADPQNIFLDVWARWDSGFYLTIARTGYTYTPGLQNPVAFFPLYPLLMHLLAPLVGGALPAGVILSNLFFLGGLILLYRLSELEFGDAATASRTAFYIAAFPTAFFFSAVYTESIFFFLSVGTLYFARRRLWAWAALFGLLCTSSRIVGVLMFGVVGLEWLLAHGWTLGTIYKRQAWFNLWQGIRRDGLSLLLLGIIPLGVVSYMVFLARSFGDPFAFSTTQAAWGRQSVGFIAAVAKDLASLWGGNVWTGDIWYHVLLDVSAFFVVVVLSFVIWRRLGASYALYSLLSILIPASSGTGSIIRYTLVIFPIFMLLGRWGRYALLDRFLLVSFSVLLGVLTSLFVNWIFVA
jgi:hypothetical protein